IKYSGSHGIFAWGGVVGITLQNNTLSYIGGAYLTGTTRFGNCIEIYTSLDTSNIDILNNAISQCFDEGITDQSSGLTADIDIDDILVEGNTISACGRGVASSFSSITGTTTKTNVIYSKNTIQNLDDAWSSPSGPNPTNGQSKGMSMNNSAADTMTGCEIRYNLIDTTESGADPIGQGISIQGTEDWAVYGNMVLGAFNSHIRIHGDVSGSIYRNVVGEITTKPGLYITDNDATLVVDNNTFHKSGGTNTNVVAIGLDSFDVTDTTFRNNIIS
ncbi:unnamed protein product, partial [marine sediment metagenome]